MKLTSNYFWVSIVLAFNQCQVYLLGIYGDKFFSVFQCVFFLSAFSSTYFTQCFFSAYFSQCLSVYIFLRVFKCYFSQYFFSVYFFCFSSAAVTSQTTTEYGPVYDITASNCTDNDINILDCLTSTWIPEDSCASRRRASVICQGKTTMSSFFRNKNAI